MTDSSLPAAIAAACPEARPAGPGDEVAGVMPAWVAAPDSVGQASALLAAAAGLGLAVLPRGSGRRLHWGLPPRRCDLVVETGRLDAVLEHSAGDQVARVQAGARLADVAAALGRAGQRLALDPPGGGTVGGLLATGVAGPLRLRYGTPRDLLLGITMVRADGVVAKAGGKVVKNVAGYDLGKLLAGSYGTLGLIVEATFRLHPRPAAAAWVTLQAAGPEQAAAALLAAGGSTLAPAAAELDWPAAGEPVSVAVLVEGEPDGVAERAGRMAELIAAAADGAGPENGAGPGNGNGRRKASGAAGAGVSAAAPGWWGGGPAAAADGTVLRAGFWAGQLAAVLRAIRAAGAAAGLDPAVGGSGAAGVLHAAVPADAPAEAVAALVAGLRERLPAGRASAVVLHAPAAVARAADVWGPVPSAALMRAVKDQFDPGHRMAPGRFAGGI